MDFNSNEPKPAPYLELATRQLPTGWAPGPSLFKDWCSRWFGPDTDDAYLLKAAQDLTTTVLGMVAIPVEVAAPVSVQTSAQSALDHMHAKCAADVKRAFAGYAAAPDPAA